MGRVALLLWTAVVASFVGISDSSLGSLRNVDPLSYNVTIASWALDLANVA